jgi:hypothetical protein
MMHEGDKFHESVGTAITDHANGGDKTATAVVVDTATPTGATGEREPRKFFPRVKLLLSVDYEPVRTLRSWPGLASLLSETGMSVWTRQDFPHVVSQSVLHANLDTFALYCLV